MSRRLRRRREVCMGSEQGQEGGALKRLGRYELLERLGRGGMAEVYKARLPGALGFDKLVAVKRILPEARGNQEFVQMFVDEARLCARMMHPNLIQVFEFAETDGELFLAMELVEGSDLRRLMTAQRQLGKPVPLEFTVLLAQGILRGLDGAHRLTDEKGRSLNVVHRDLSPANVLLSYEGVVKVADFGVAHQGQASEGDDGTIKGKLQYMAPEQLLTGDVDLRVDVFSAGCVVYELLTGSPVYPPGQTAEVIRQVAQAQHVPVAEGAPGVPAELAAAVERALSRERRQRFQDCAAFADELARLVQAGRLPCATGEELGLYLQVLLPNEEFRAELTYTPSAADVAVPIVAGELLEEFPDLVIPTPTPAPMAAVTGARTARPPSGAVSFPSASSVSNPGLARPKTVPPPAEDVDRMLRAYLDDPESSPKPAKGRK